VIAPHRSIPLASPAMGHFEGLPQTGRICLMMRAYPL